MNLCFKIEMICILQKWNVSSNMEIRRLNKHDKCISICTRYWIQLNQRLHLRSHTASWISSCPPTQVHCGEVELEKKIDEKIDIFIDKVEKHPNKKNQICLSFYEMKNRQATWFTNKVERLYWEQWYINVNVVQHPKSHHGKSHHSKILVDPGDSMLEERTVRRAALESSLREILFQIIKFVNEKKDHVPPIPNLDGLSFPYEITISSSSDSTFGMDMLKRMLQTGHPTMLS